MTRPRVLLIAEAANPEWTSVPLVGWSHARALMDVADVHLVTQVRNRAAILRAGLVEGRDFTAIDSEAVARRVYALASHLRGGDGKGWTTLTALSRFSYAHFERLLWRRFRGRIAGGEFDIVHRLTPLSPTIPSAIAGKCRRLGVPFVLGPLNGGVPWPKGFGRARWREREWLSYLRGVYRLLPGYRSTLRNAATILVGSRDTLAQIPGRYHGKCVYLPENGIDPARFTARRTRRAAKPLRAIFVGRLVPYKGADMLLEAAAPLLRAGSLTLDIVGDGPQMPELRGFVDAQGLACSVRFHGWGRHAQVQYLLAESDLLTFPSIREFGGGVVLEAMAVGVVPVVVDYGGPAELVSDASAFTIPLGRRSQIVDHVRETLESSVAQPKLVDQRGDIARERTRACFAWPSKARQVAGVYERLLAGQRQAASGRSIREPRVVDRLGFLGKGVS